MSFGRWRTILVNWVNCYVDHTDWTLQPEKAIEVILDKLSSSSLDRSGSIEGQTLSSFIIEKFPNFIFQNGTSQPSNDDDLYMAASLLLFYVCVHSKDAEMRNMMCKKLSSEDQEVILKFTKSLMSKSQIKYSDVCAAIVDCSGPNNTQLEISASTPPQLRSLHGEVRRLRAALDAERFDRSYLQDELASLNARLDKLAKEKEHYQKEVASLRAQVEERQQTPQHSAASPAGRQRSRRLQRQMSAAEERLIETQGLLEESERARDAYRNKMEELKRQRDEYLAHATTETERANTLADALEAERSATAALRESLAEFRLHRLQRDESVECDDDPRNRSIANDTSLCNEACTGVIEVQLLEERARVAALTEEVQSYQNKVEELEKELLDYKNDTSIKIKTLHTVAKETEVLVESLTQQQAEMRMKLDSYEKSMNEMQICNMQLEKDIEHKNVELDQVKQEVTELVTKEIHLNKTIAAKQSEIELLNSEKNKTGEIIAALTQHIDVQENKRTCLEQKCAEFEKQIKSYQTELQELHNENISLREGEENLHKHLKEIKDQKCELDKEVHNLRNVELPKIRQDYALALETLSHKVEEIRYLKDKLEQDTVTFNSKINSLKFEHEEDKRKMTEEIEELKKQKETIERNNEEYENMIITDQAKIAIMQEEYESNLTSKDAVIDNLKADFKNLESDFYTHKCSKELQISELSNNLETVRSTMGGEILSLKTIISEIEKEKCSLESAVNEFYVVIQSYRRDFAIKETCKYDVMTSNVVDVLHCQSVALEYIKNEIASLLSQNQSKIEELEDENIRYNSVIASHKSNIDTLENDLENFSIKVQEFEKENTFLCKEVTSYKEIANALRSEIRQIQSEKQELSKKLGDIYALNEEHQQKEKDLKAFVSDLKEQMGNLTKTTARSIEEQNNCHYAYKEEMKKKIDTYEFIKQQLDQEIFDYSQAVKKYKSQIVSQEHQIKDLSSKLQETQAEAVRIAADSSKLNVLIENLTSENKSYRTHSEEISIRMKTISDELTSVKTCLDETTKQFEKTVCEYEYEIEKFKAQAQDMKDNKESMEKEMKCMKLKIQGIENEKEDLLSARSEYKILLDNLNAETEKLRTEGEERNAIIQNFQQELAIIKNSLENKSKQYNEILCEYNTHSDKYKSEVAKLNTDIVLQKAETLNIKDSFEKVIERLQLQIKEIENEKNTHIDKESQYKTFIDKLQSENNIFKITIEEITKEMTDTTNEVISMQKEIQNLKLQIQEIEKEKEILFSKESEYQIKIENLLVENNELNSNIQQITNKHVSSLDQLKTTQKLLADKTKEYNDIASQLENELERFRKQEDCLKNYIEAQKDEMTSNMQCVEKEMQALRIAMKEIQQDKERLCADGIEYTILIDDLRSENLKLKIHNEEMTSQVANIKEELELTNKSLEVILKDHEYMISKFSTDTEKFKNCAQEMTNVVFAQKSEMSANKESHDKAVSDLLEIMKETELNLNLKDETISSLESTIVRLKQNIDILTTTSTEEKRLIENSSKEMENLLAKAKSEALTLRQEITHLKQKCDNYNKQCNELNKQKSLLALQLEHKTKELNEKLDSVKENKAVVERKTSDQEIEIARLLQENETLKSELSGLTKKFNGVLEKIQSILNAHNISDVTCEEEIISTLHSFITSQTELYNLEQTEKNYLEKTVADLKNQVKTLEQGTYSAKLKFKFIMSQNIGYLDTMTNGTDLFENKYSFISQDICSVPDASEDFEHFVTAVEKILSRNKAITNVFKTEYNSISEMYKQVVKERDAASNRISILKKECDIKIQILTDQLNDKQALVTHLEKDIAVMENDKNSIINNLNLQLKNVSDNESKQTEEYKQKIETLNIKLEELEQAKQSVITDAVEEFRKKEDTLIKEHAEKIEHLVQELNVKNETAERMENYILKLITYVTDTLKNLTEDCKETHGCVDLSYKVKLSICDEEKMKNACGKEHIGPNLNDSVKERLTDFNDLIEKIKHKLITEMTYTKQLQNQLAAKTTLVQSLEQDIASVEVRLDELNHDYCKAQQENQDLIKLTKTDECKIKELESVVAEMNNVLSQKENALKDIEIRYDEAKSEKHQSLQAMQEERRALLFHLNKLVDSNDPLEMRKTVTSIEAILNEPSEMDSKVDLKLGRLMMVVEDLKAKNNLLTIKCEEMEHDKNLKIDQLKNKVESLSKSIAHREVLVNDVRESKEKDVAELQMQVEMLSSDLLGTSEERSEIISNLEKIVQDKNRTITTLQGDITYMKSLVADSENKLLDMTKELEQYKENCDQLSQQLRKAVSLKNEEIANLKRQLQKVSNHENGASQIIKVSAKYQAIILKRIAEIRSNPLRELRQFENVDDKRLSLVGGTVTTDDLENFLESTEKYLRKLDEKQLALQKERDRLADVSKINESETLSLKKYLTELLAHFKTFTSVKDMYNQKLSQVISKQRMIRREIHNLDNTIPDGIMAKLERSYSIVMQDLCETSLNLGRWAERCIDRSISPEKLKQAFANDAPALSTSYFQNTSLEIQIEELMTAFKKVYEEVQAAKSSQGTRNEACSVMQVRAEYEEKLGRMKAKMKQLYQEQMSLHQERMESELEKMRRKMEEKTSQYEEHIKSLTKELWNVGEKALMQKEETDWLRRRQSSATSLMSLQHVHSSGLGPPPPRDSRSARDSRNMRDSRESLSRGVALDTQSLHNFPPKPSGKENRGIHMSDEEGEVFDNRWLRDLETPPRPERDRRRTSGVAFNAGRVSELQYRNSLCPPHLKSSYAVETHLAPVPVPEEEIKCEAVERRIRKEVGITAYKKPGPPTPSKSAGRLSATDSELRESLRQEPDGPAVVRKTSTPSRLRALFRGNSSNTENTGTPRSKRLSIFRKK